MSVVLPQLLLQHFIKCSFDTLQLRLHIALCLAIDDKDLLTRLAVARARIQALSRRQDLPPEVVQAYLRPPM